MKGQRHRQVLQTRRRRRKGKCQSELSLRVQKTTASRKPVEVTPPTTSAGFNKECLSILLEMNIKLSNTSDKVEKLSDRVDTLYDYYDYNEGYEYGSDQEVYMDPLDADQEEQASVSFSDKRSIHDVDSDDDVFSNFMKKFKKTDKVDAEVSQNLADMINSTFREGMPDETYNEIIKKINRPENCFALKETRVNAGVWSVLKPQTQTEDSKMRGIQNAFCKAGCNLANLINQS
ncbi:MAG: hypothetical protein JAY75_21550 [Candidatus Thiodiazotropha taylori]|nr:hypothetical protein [Candidatus Thiodiazotropha taylori]MCW4310806.1 hypothetical protein [Candidatus Thiodiazotropha endolucinida]